MRLLNKLFTKRVLSNQDGSMIVVAILVLALLTVIGLMSSDSVVTENMIIRNVGIHKQNVNLVESAVMEGVQQVMQLEYPDETDAQLQEASAGQGSGEDVSLWLTTDGVWDSTAGAWGYSLDENWYTHWWSNRVLDPGSSGLNLKVPDMASSTSGQLQSSVLATRGEIDSGNIQMALVGWEPSFNTGGQSLKATQPNRRFGRIRAEYMSPRYGIVRLEVGIERIF